MLPDSQNQRNIRALLSASKSNSQVTRTRAYISVTQRPRDEISSSGDHDPNVKDRPPTNNNNNRMPGSVLSLLWGEEESTFERENWIPCWSLGFKDERRQQNASLIECPWVECLDAYADLVEMKPSSLKKASPFPQKIKGCGCQSRDASRFPKPKKYPISSFCLHDDYMILIWKNN
ncbi:hypothetical protein CEXT_475151 [Caerostris extrusa]|uniref:Uncharacterized protein n=1 Tax=Caerostris extrusa TaxID=172846 RepID=A0AAV4MQN4_CAEEX|nr:hypothetical protein CEXT_475151 [Caerostris extrusa]